MRACLTLSVLCLAFSFTGCSKSDTAQAPAAPPPPTTPEPGQKSTNGIDACSLLTSKEIESIQGAPLKDTRPSANSQGAFTVSQCYFLLPIAAESIALTVTQKASGADARDPKQLWEETFHRDNEKAEAGGEEKSKSPPPEKIADVGDEAFWAPTAFGGALYALKGNIYIRISVGGPGDQAAKIQKSKALAEIVLKRL